jgi:hypothetical protein
MIKLPENLPDQSKPDKPSASRQYVDSKRKADLLTENDPSTRYIGIPKTAFKPNDFCEKFADMLVNPVSRNLNEANLKMKVDDFLKLLVKTYGSPYKVTDDWFGQKRPVKTKPNGKGLSIAKVVDRLRHRGIEVSAIDANKMSFNDVRKHLQGKGLNQEFTVKLESIVVLGRSRVTINRKVFHWINHIGQECFSDTATGLRSASGVPPSIISVDMLESLVGTTWADIQRRCDLAPV